ncbi:MAG: Hsp20/alpha crystallin family protein [Saprospiraceae bacterium]|nr:Hsp20/alpha crystallin family protein [Candidatus Opimibacter iunctus]
MSLIKWNEPTKLMGKRNWVENFFAETDDFLKNWNWDMKVDVPAINVKEEKDAFLIDVAAPGMKREDFKVEVDRGVLIISATTEEKKEEKTDTFRRQEFSYRDFRRSFWLPENIMADQIAAQYENGILKLKIPKMENVPEKAKTIKVV